MSHDIEQHSSHDEHFDAAKATKTYLLAFVACVFLTVVPFVAVMGGTLEKANAIALIAATAVIQVIVRIYYFLHIDSSKKQRWNLLSLGFALIIVAIVMIGSWWVMYNLHINMMY